MSRTPIMAGNWKMNLDHIAATSLVQDLGEALKSAGYDPTKSEAVVIPPFTDIRTVATIIDGDKLPIAYGAQDISCLLYTSPSPRDRQKSRMPSSA